MELRSRNQNMLNVAVQLQRHKQLCSRFATDPFFRAVYTVQWQRVWLSDGWRGGNGRSIPPEQHHGRAAAIDHISIHVPSNLRCEERLLCCLDV